jgi:hypothetical protein
VVAIATMAPTGAVPRNYIGRQPPLVDRI